MRYAKLSTYKCAIVFQLMLNILPFGDTDEALGKSWKKLFE